MRVLVALLLGQLPQSTLDLPQSTVVAVVEPVRPAEPDSATIKTMARIEDSINHLGDRVSTVERVAKYAARKVAQTIDASPTAEDTGLDGWVAPIAARPAVPPGSVWCVECQAYVPASHFAAPSAYQTPTSAYTPAYAAYRPVARQAPAFARGGG